jgi:PAS domain S-box-containing protein
MKEGIGHSNSLFNADEEVKLSDEILRELFENSSDMVMISDFDGTIKYLSPNLTKLLGYTLSSFKSQDIARSLVHPDDRKAYYGLFYDVRQSPGKSCGMLGRFKHADGQYVWIEGQVTNMLDTPSVKGIVSNFRDITDRKIAQEKLLQSEDRYRKIVETAQEGIWVLDENLVTVFANQKLCDLLEYPVEEVIGKHNYDFKENTELEITLNRLENRKKGKIESHESAFITKSGKRILLDITSSGLFDDNGKFLGTLAMLTDITQRRVQEEALKKSEANLSAIIENTSDLVYSLDTDHRFITYNKLFKDTMKQVYSFDISEGTNTLDLINTFDTETAGKWKETYAKAFNGETIHFVNEYAHGGGKIYLSYSLNPIWESGKVIGLSCFSRDITRQKLDEIAVKKSEASLRTIFNNIDLSCIVIDANQNIVSFNTLAQKFSQEQANTTLVEGAPFLDAVRADRMPQAADALKRVKEGEAVNYEASWVTGGHEKWFDMTWLGIKNFDKEDFGYMLMIRDITEKKKAELEREKITNDLLQRNKALEQFTYIISHNLRSPVANIMGLSTLLKYAETSKECADIAGGIETSAVKLDEVITDLNQVLQVKEQVNENLEVVHLSTLIDDIKAIISTLIAKEQVELIADFTKADAIVTLKSFMHSIFYNLIVNSIKYRRVGVAPKITIATSVDNGKMQIRYKDNGRGIDTEKHKDYLFGLYKRFDTSVEGKGMGLFMVKMQVESLGGTVNMHSKLEEGTEFRLEFPLTVEQENNRRSG